MGGGVAPAQLDAGDTVGGDGEGVALDGGGVGEGASCRIVDRQVGGGSVKVQAVGVSLNRDFAV